MDATEKSYAMKAREKAVQSLLLSVGEDPKREGLIDTPKRVARMYEELFAGYEQDPKKILSRVFTAESQDMVLVRNIQFYSHCEHHMVPFYGLASVAYIPNKKLVGISKLARLVECYARRLQIQERMTVQIADAIEEALQPFGVAVIIEAEHMCMKMRGIKNPCADTVTSTVRGIFKLDEKARSELMSLIYGRK
jgi:GTP cyclohydrolase I